MARSHREAQRRLFEITETQQGFFTAKQAKAAGFAENTHPYHVQVGNWIREHRGIYRLALFPPGEHPDLMKWALWSKNRNEVIEGVYSHQTALSRHELSDLNPAKLHMTVPTLFRRNSEIPGILVLHYADLADEDVQTAQGVKYTRPLRTILDLIEADSVERIFLRQALRQGLHRGLITRSEVKRVKLSAPAQGVFEDLLRQVA
ncbi:MAG: type IV toxin-antitoxin system AbiEi family antitoxin domain-containing protein [Acidobacteria bacterium]|nr:type IV toxin-antitoxin system AbiEi family antitoxin domain-containing protein [Acidobacteriota bacterium]MBI3470006.1 type IV toxin-antitoxin system AbiEi family antitoxin domain-containing protein [Candidatus Solibacter usitatus]